MAGGGGRWGCGYSNNNNKEWQEEAGEGGVVIVAIIMLNKRRKGKSRYSNNTMMMRRLGWVVGMSGTDQSYVWRLWSVYYERWCWLDRP